MGLLRSLKWILLVPIPFPCSSCGAANSSQLPLLLAIALSPKEDSSPGGYAFPPWFSQFAKGWPSYLKVRPRQKPGSCWDHIIACLLPLPPHLLRSPLPSEFLLTKSHAPESPPPPSGFVSGEAKLLPNIMSEETGSLRTSVMESQKLASSRARLEPRCIWHPSTAWKLHLAGIKPVLPGKQVATPPDICVCCPSTSVSFYTHLLQKWKPRPSKS